MFSAMLTDAFQDGDNEIPIRYHFDGNVASYILGANRGVRWVPIYWRHGKGCSNRREVANRCESSIWFMWKLWSHNKHQNSEVVYQPAPANPYKESTITVKGQWLQVVYKFTYLGCLLSRVVYIDDEVNARIVKASAAFGRLLGDIWDWSGIRLDTKLKVYRSMVLSKLLYACETLTVYQRHAKRLNHFHTSCFRKPKNQVAREDSRHRLPEKDRDVECTYSYEIDTLMIHMLP